MPYVDGFVIPIAKKNVPKYRKMAAKAGRIWIEHGALEYRECIGDELVVTNLGTGEQMRPFVKTLKLKPTETAIFAWIVYRNKAERNKVNARVMKDPRSEALMDAAGMPFDEARMNYGGFRTIVDFAGRGARAR